MIVLFFKPILAIYAMMEIPLPIMILWMKTATVLESLMIVPVFKQTSVMVVTMVTTILKTM